MTPRSRIKKFVVEWPEPSRKQMLGFMAVIVSGIVSIYGFYNTHLHNETVAKQDTVIAAVKGDTSKSRRIVVADLDTIKSQMQLVIATLNTISVSNQTMTENLAAFQREDSSKIANVYSIIHIINQTDMMQTNELASIRQGRKSN